MDKQEYRKRVLLGLLTRPLTILPLVGGASLLIGSWALGQGGGALPFVGFLGMLGGVGSFLTSAFTGGGKVAEKVVEDLRREGQKSRERSLDELERRLTTDGDPRTERALRDLRGLARSLDQEDAWSSEFNARTGFDILSDVNRLFETSVGYLEKSLEIWRTAQGIRQPKVRETLMEQREHLVRDVQGGVEHLADVLAQLQALQAGAGSHSAIQNLRAELDQNLEVARRVEERMAEWDAPHAEFERAGE
jgi:hypothetical protein